MVRKNADRVSDAPIDWDSIDWNYHEKVVRRLQERIAKAEQEGDRDKVHNLRRLLTRSHSGKLLAIKRVTENDGSKTPGVDKIVWEHPRSKEMAVTLLNERGYKPRPLRRIYIPKSNGKMRPLGIPTMLDRAMQALHLLALDPIAETHADPNSYGFRTGRSCADAMEQLFKLCQGGRDRWILEGDIRACFDKISHEWLLDHIPMNKTILRKWLKCGYIEKDVLTATVEGTPQGGIISPVLANMALDGLEALLRKHYPLKGPGSVIARKACVKLVRYADDFVITGSSKELLETEVRPLVIQFLLERGLELSIEKTKITHLRDGFDFLGQNVRAYGKKTIVKPSRKAVAAFLTKIRSLIKASGHLTAAELIRLLNPKIGGWTNHHKHACSARAFSYIDSRIFRSLTVWARRRHKRDAKNRHWIADKYFGDQDGRRWCFFGDQTNKKGERERIWLKRASDTKIVRHIKVQSAAHPYDPRWYDYWCERQRRDRKGAGQSHRRFPEFVVAPLRPDWGV